MASPPQSRKKVNLSSFPPHLSINTDGVELSEDDLEAFSQELQELMDRYGISFIDAVDLDFPDVTQ